MNYFFQNLEIFLGLNIHKFFLKFCNNFQPISANVSAEFFCLISSQNLRNENVSQTQVNNEPAFYNFCSFRSFPTKNIFLDLAHREQNKTKQLLLEGTYIPKTPTFSQLSLPSKVSCPKNKRKLEFTMGQVPLFCCWFE